MANNKYLLRLFKLQGAVEEAGQPLAEAIDTALMAIEDNEPVSAHWGNILLQIALLRRQLEQVERNVLKARSEPSLSWRYEH